MYRAGLSRISRSITTRCSYQTWAYEKNATKMTPQFVVTPDTGFLPRSDPIAKLPEQFKELEHLLQRMPLVVDGKPGLLAKGSFGEAVRKELPQYDISKVDSTALQMALFRDYTFAASAYLLEPCDLQHKKDGTFAHGRDHLPPNIAVPLMQISDKIGAKPFMEYAQSYALYNYKRKTESNPVTYHNLELVRKFSGLPSESGFILVHVDMVANTNRLVTHTIRAMDAAAVEDRVVFDDAMADLVSTMREINKCMEKMWERSSPSDYMKFRTFILGTKNQDSIFPNGVVYQGTSDTTPKFFRGESGANDSIIPTVDNLLQLTAKMPQNDMTSILKDFRSYRPKEHSAWLNWVETSATTLGIERYAGQASKSLVLYIQLLDEVRDFRARHWNFAKEYIIKRTAYPVATGGSPMASWLPNQLMVVLQTLQDKYTMYQGMKDKGSGSLDGCGLPDSFHRDVVAQQSSLQADMARMSQMYGKYTKASPVVQVAANSPVQQHQ